MATLVDHQIRDLALTQELIVPYNEEQLNPASYDVTLGELVYIEVNPVDVEALYPRKTLIDGRWVEWNIKTDPLYLAPGEFILAHTAECIHVPEYAEAIFCLKSSRGREGWEHALAGYCDAGFKGKVTLELKNNNRYHTLHVYAGLKIGQIRFSTLNGTPERSYKQTGRYNNATTLETSKG